MLHYMNRIDKSKLQMKYTYLATKEETIREHVGKCEIHNIKTEDGYILNIIRIPQENSKGVILFQHPIFFDARVWVSHQNNSIAFFFWRAGYDVWLGNTRGNKFCQRHVSYETTNPQFWDFSFHEMGYYDNCAIIKYITHYTNVPKIVYLGLSMGATNGLVFASTRSKIFESSIKAIVLLAPVANIYNGSSFAKYTVIPLCSFVNFIGKDNRDIVCLQNGWYLKFWRFLSYWCAGIVRYGVNLICGFGDEKVENEKIISFFHMFGMEVPWKIFFHFYQLYINGGKFRFYDYGKQKNLTVYGKEVPPFYPIDEIKVPVIIVCGEKDSFVCPKDAGNLYKDLSKNFDGHKYMLIEGFNHVDFILHTKREERVYSKILEELDQI